MLFEDGRWMGQGRQTTMGVDGEVTKVRRSRQEEADGSG